MLSEAAGDTVAIVDPYTIGYLTRLYLGFFSFFFYFYLFFITLFILFFCFIFLGGNNNDRVTYVTDTFGRTAKAGSSVNATVSVRNDGWNTLNQSKWKKGDRTNERRGEGNRVIARNRQGGDKKNKARKERKTRSKLLYSKVSVGK
jgi:hypothetical protein